MADQPQQNSNRAEKLSVLSALLGPEALARIRENRPDLQRPAGETPAPVDADRVAWHRNRLLERLRTNADAQSDSAKNPGPARETRPATANVPGELPAKPAGGSGVDTRLQSNADPASLSEEHPAVIARLLSAWPRDERVAALKSLPGPVARSVVRRLR